MPQYICGGSAKNHQDNSPIVTFFLIQSKTQSCKFGIRLLSDTRILVSTHKTTTAASKKGE